MAVRRDDPMFSGGAAIQLPATVTGASGSGVVRSDTLFSGGLGLLVPSIVFGTDTSPSEVDPALSFDSAVVTFDSDVISWDET